MDAKPAVVPDAQPAVKAARAKKSFVLDTNVLIHDPACLTRFEKATVVLPLEVIEELDAFKRYNDDRGFAVRQVTRLLDRLRTKGKLSQGVPFDHGGRLIIEHRKVDKLPLDLGRGPSAKDNGILATALYLKSTGAPTVLISKDMNLRIKAEVLGLETEDYEREKVTVEGLYKGWREAPVSPEDLDRFYKDKGLAAVPGLPDLFANEFVILKAEGKSQSGLGRWVPGKGLLPLRFSQQKPWGIKPLNVQQRFALELLLDQDVSLTALLGVPGSGKTLLALAAGLEQVIEEPVYRRLLISRPVVPVGRDIGYLPGSKEEKLSSWIGAIKDNIEFLSDQPGPAEADRPGGVADDILNSDKVEIEAVSFLRGRSLPRVYFIIDDSQNLTPHEVKTIISRAGEGTKIVLTGDPYQIDNPYLDASSNGLSNLVDRFKGQSVFGAVKFDKIERSRLAALASELL